MPATRRRQENTRSTCPHPLTLVCSPSAPARPPEPHPRPIPPRAARNLSPNLGKTLAPEKSSLKVFQDFPGNGPKPCRRFSGFCQKPGFLETKRKAIKVRVKQKCFICSTFHGRACRWAVLGGLNPEGPKGTLHTYRKKRCIKPPNHHVQVKNLTSGLVKTDPHHLVPLWNFRRLGGTVCEHGQFLHPFTFPNHGSPFCHEPSASDAFL